jgi:hypothetical protein
MVKPAPMAFLLLAGIVASPARAEDERFGRIWLDVPGSWTLKLLDREEDPKASFKFPWYVNDKPGDYAQRVDWGTLLKSPGGSFVICPVAGTAAKSLGKTGEDYDLEGQKEYSVSFYYGTIGLKAFNHVFYLYGKEKSAFLVKVEAKTTDTGPTLKVKLLAQADYDKTIKKFKAGKNDVYQFTANGTLVKRDKNDGSSADFISVKKK